jgi:hypothetical protein
VKGFSCICGARRVLLVVVALLARDTGRADGPWNEKPYGDWDRSDVRRILLDSPWVRHFTRTKRALEFEAPDQGPSGMELRGYHAKQSKEDGAETTEFYIRWVSSRTMREASARRLVLLKQVPPNATETNPPKVLDEFEVAIAGPNMSVFDNMREETLRSKCYLWISSKRKIAPSRVEFARSGTGKVRGVLFRFPRKTPDGEPLISTHDRKVWFIEYGGGVAIRVTFNPQAMVDANGLDL